jgi:hypothetical protein
MNALLNTTSHVNGGQPVINGRGLAHRKLTNDELDDLAADIATGQRPFIPSLKDISFLTGRPVAKIRQKIKARTAQAKNQEADAIQAFVESWERLAVTRETAKKKR